jgi:hypothetical protein
LCVGVREGIRKAFVGECLSHILDGARTGICAYKFSILFSGAAVVSGSDCLSECRETTVSSHVRPVTEEGVSGETKVGEKVQPSRPSPVCVGVSAGLNGEGS